MAIKAFIGERIDDMEIIKILGCKDGNNNRIVTKCCKCYRTKELNYGDFKRHRGTKHEHCSRLIIKPKKFYAIWEHMKRRTNNPKDKKYKNYGGRGINSNAWKYFIDFYDDMYESYLEHVEKYGEWNTTIERIDVNGNYCKDNCKWATWKEQHGNTTKNKWFKAVSPNGEVFYSKNQTEFARIHNLNQQQICQCIKGTTGYKTHKGWKFEKMEEDEIC